MIALILLSTAGLSINEVYTVFFEDMYEIAAGQVNEGSVNAEHVSP